MPDVRSVPTKNNQNLAGKGRRFITALAIKADSHPYVILGVIVSLALVINILSLNLRPPTLDTKAPEIGQTYRWWPLILNVINGRGYLLCVDSYFPLCSPANEVTASLEPVPVFFFGGVALLTGQSLLATGVAEVGINLIILLITFALARLLSNVRAALLAAFVWATYVPAIKLVSQISGDLLGTCFLTLGLFLFLRAQRAQHAHRWRDWIFSGIALGLGIQSRSASLAVIPGLLLGLLLEGWIKNPGQWAQLAKKIAPGIVISFIVFAMMIPWFVRNLKSFGSPVLGTSLTGYVLYRQNYMLGTNDYFRIVAPDEAHRAVDALVARRADLKGPLNEIQMDAVYRSEAIKIIGAYPGRYILLSLYRFLPLWFNWKVPEAYGEKTSAIGYAVMVEQVFLLFAGLWGAWKTRWRSWPLWLSIALLILAYMAVNAQIRYLVLVIPCVISLAVVGVQDLFTGPNKEVGEPG